MGSLHASPPDLSLSLQQLCPKTETVMVNHLKHLHLVLNISQPVGSLYWSTTAIKGIKFHPNPLHQRNPTDRDSQLRSTNRSCSSSTGNRSTSSRGSSSGWDSTSTLATLHVPHLILHLLHHGHQLSMANGLGSRRTICFVLPLLPTSPRTTTSTSRCHSCTNSITNKNQSSRSGNLKQEHQIGLVETKHMQASANR